MVEERLFDWEGDSDLFDLSIVVPILWLKNIRKDSGHCPPALLKAVSAHTARLQPQYKLLLLLLDLAVAVAVLPYPASLSPSYPALSRCRRFTLPCLAVAIAVLPRCRCSALLLLYC